MNRNKKINLTTFLSGSILRKYITNKVNFCIFFKDSYFRVSYSYHCLFLLYISITSIFVRTYLKSSCNKMLTKNTIVHKCCVNDVLSKLFLANHYCMYHSNLTLYKYYTLIKLLCFLKYI